VAVHELPTALHALEMALPE